MFPSFLTLLRTLAGPLMVGLAVWCAAGTLTVASADAAAVRIAVPGPAWIWPAATLAACLVRAWRRWPLTALPAVLTVLPWLPVPLPTVALVWTGTLAWVPPALAAVVAVATGGGPGRRAVPWATSTTGTGRERDEPTGPADDGNPGAQSPGYGWLAAAALTTVGGLLVLASIGPRLPGGDEPHYLVIAQSLLEDGDIRIDNQHDARTYATWWRGGELPPHYIERGRDGGIYSIHAPGVAALVAPLFALAGVPGAQATILALAAAAGALVWLLGLFASGSRAAAWFAWAAVSASSTMLVQSVTIFPDGPGAAFTAAVAVIWLALRQQRLAHPGWLVAASALLAALPFLHTRFAVISAVFGLLFTYDLVRVPRPDRALRLAAFVVPALLGATAWFGLFHAIYGTPDPTAPYGDNRESSLTYVPGGVLGLLVDQQFGLLVFSPVLALGPVGWWLERRSSHRAALPLVPVVVCYLAAVATYWMWWAGVPATPARFATAIVPLLAPALAIAWNEGGRFFRTLASVLVAGTGAISIFILRAGGTLAWDVRGGRAAWLDALASVADLPRAWPGFFWMVVGGEVRTELPFALHAAAMLGAVALVAAAAARFVRGRTAPVVVTAAVLVPPVALMLTAAIGWWLNDVGGLAPARSQLHVLRAAAAGETIWRVTPLRVARVDAATPPVVVTWPRADLPIAPHASWADLHGIPAGRYQLHLASPRPAGGRLVVRGPDASLPVVDAGLAELSRHAVPVDLRSGWAALRVEADGTLVTHDTRIELVPDELVPGPFRGARAFARTAGVQLFLLDRNVSIEDGAFWVSGESTAGVVFAPDDHVERLRLRLVNGPEGNHVDVRTDTATWSDVLAAGEVRDLDLPLSTAGTAFLEITSRRGFRPSDDGVSSDRRYLGVRIEIGPAGESPAGP